MKTAGRENPTHGVAWPRNRAHGAVGQNRSRSVKWAAKQEKFQPKEMCFFLTSPFIELSTTRCAADGASGSAAGTVGGGQETPGLETALSDSFDRSDPDCGIAGHSADSAPFSHQAAAMGVQRFQHRDTKQRRSP